MWTVCKCIFALVGGLFAWGLRLLSGEFLLKWHANGGGIILLRAGITTAVVFGSAVSLEAWLCDRTFALSKGTFQGKVEWLGVIGAAVYAAYYSRFSSQWTYLANLYNQIKEVEATRPPNELASWKAGFIEDAYLVHLFRKKPFADVIRAWAREPDIRMLFVQNTSNGESEWGEIMHALRAPCGCPCDRMRCGGKRREW